MHRLASDKRWQKASWNLKVVHLKRTNLKNWQEKKDLPINNQKLYSKRREEKEKAENTFEETMARSVPYLLGEKIFTN